MRSIVRFAITLTSLSLTSVPELRAQRIMPVAPMGRSASVYQATAPSAHGRYRLEMPAAPSHWKAGAVAGAAIGIIFANFMMDETASIGRRVGLSLVAGAVFAIPGALIGGVFPKAD